MLASSMAPQSFCVVEARYTCTDAMQPQRKSPSAMRQCKMCTCAAVKVVTWLTMPLEPGSDNPSLQIANMQVQAPVLL